MSEDHELTLHVGRDELVVRRRYQALSIANDVAIAVWFLVGSILFLWEQTTTVAVWLFILGSAEFLARPAIRLARLVHLRRMGADETQDAGEY